MLGDAVDPAVDPAGDSAADRRLRDRRLVDGIVLVLLGGIGMTLVGGIEIWWSVIRGHGLHGRRALKVLGGAAVVGPPMIGIALYEAWYRIRRGPQPPGRHSRADA